jgi:hypothetical protein
MADLFLRCSHRWFDLCCKTGRKHICYSSEGLPGERIKGEKPRPGSWQHEATYLGSQSKAMSQARHNLISELRFVGTLYCREWLVCITKNHNHMHNSFLSFWTPYQKIYLFLSMKSAKPFFRHSLCNSSNAANNDKPLSKVLIIVSKHPVDCDSLFTLLQRNLEYTL